MTKYLHHPHRVLPPHVFLLVVIVTLITMLFLLWAPSAGAVTEIDRCGETVAAGETAYLSRDLDCRGSGSEGVVLSHRSRLVMAGHTIFGDPADASDDGRPWQGVRCETGTTCSVTGPGAILGFSASGIAGTRVRVRDVLIAENGRAGIAAYENVVLRDVVIGDNGTIGVHAGGRIKLKHSAIAAHPSADILEGRSPRYRPRRGRRADTPD